MDVKDLVAELRGAADALESEVPLFLELREVVGKMIHEYHRACNGGMRDELCRKIWEVEAAYRTIERAECIAAADAE